MQEVVWEYPAGGSRTRYKAEIIKTEDLDKISEYGVMITPTLVINNEIFSPGKVLSTEDIKKVIKLLKQWIIII